jgi:hypothetical protein
MNSFTRITSALVCAVALTSCSTTIIDTVQTTLSDNTTTTTTTIPSGDILSLLTQLSSVTDGLGQAIVDGDSAIYKQRAETAHNIWKVLEPQIRAEGIDLVEDVERIIGLIDTATKRKRPADADKASRFLQLIQESAQELLAK